MRVFERGILRFFIITIGLTMLLGFYFSYKEKRKTEKSTSNEIINNNQKTIIEINNKEYIQKKQTLIAPVSTPCAGSDL